LRQIFEAAVRNGYIVRSPVLGMHTLSLSPGSRSRSQFAAWFQEPVAPPPSQMMVQAVSAEAEARAVSVPTTIMAAKTTTLMMGLGTFYNFLLSAWADHGMS
jgi:hypothetical protein